MTVTNFDALSPVVASKMSHAAVHMKKVRLRLSVVAVVGFTAIGSAVAEVGDACRTLAPGQQGYFNHHIHVVVQRTGSVEVSAEQTFTACMNVGARLITVERMRFAARFQANMVVTHGNVQAELVSVPGAGGSEAPLVFAAPAMAPGDTLKRSITASWPALLGSNQIWAQEIAEIGQASAVRLVVEAERIDVKVRLSDPEGLLDPVSESPARWEWNAPRRRAGANVVVPWLALTTFSSWESVAGHMRYVPTEQQLRETESLGIGRATDAWDLFRAFAQRFPATATVEEKVSPDNLRKLRGWDREASAVVLFRLFKWNGIEAELVLLFGKHGGAQPEPMASGPLDHVLIYVPALDQYFDPTLPSERQRSSELVLQDEKPRLHFATTRRHTGGNSSECATGFCLSYFNGRRDVHSVRVKTEAIRGPAMPVGDGTRAPSDDPRK
jgi:hypothetical protein